MIKKGNNLIAFGFIASVIFVIFNINTAFAGGTKTIYSGAPVSITWNVGNAEGCTPTTNYPVTSDGVAESWTDGPRIATSVQPLPLGNPRSIGTFNFTCSSYNPSGASDSATLTVLDGDCDLPWGGRLSNGNSVTAYQSASVNSPATCTSETRTCTNGVLSGSYTNNTCVLVDPLKSGSISGPNSCVVVSGNSTCTVPLTWQSTNFSSPKLIDQNTGAILSTLSDKEQPGLTVWVAYGGTTVKLNDGNTTYATKVVSASCESGSSWNGTICVSTVGKSGSISGPNSCVVNAGNSTCTVPLTWTSTGFSSPNLFDNNVSSILSTNGSESAPGLTVWVAYGGTTFKLRDGVDVYDTKVVSASCASGSAWNGSICQGTGTGEPPGGCPPGSTWNGTICATNSNTPNPTVIGATVTPNCVSTVQANPTLVVQCQDSDNYIIQNSSDQIIASGNGQNATISLPGDDTYGVTCRSGSTPSTKVFRTYALSMCGTQIISFTGSPVTIRQGGLSTLSWKISGPNNSCTISATPVCANGTCSQSVNDAATLINDTLQNTNTDQNDPNTSRPVPGALTTTAPSSSYAVGKKTIKINYTTDFTVSCGVGVSRKIRILVTNSNEG